MSKLNIKENNGLTQLNFNESEINFVYECKGLASDLPNIVSIINNFFNNGIAGTAKLIVTGTMGIPTSNSNITSPNTRMAIMLVDFEDCYIPEIEITTTSRTFLSVSNNVAIIIKGLKINYKTIGTSSPTFLSLSTNNNVYLDNCSFFVDDVSLLTTYRAVTSSGKGVYTFNNCYFSINMSIPLENTFTSSCFYVSSANGGTLNIFNTIIDVKYTNQTGTRYFDGIHRTSSNSQYIINIKNSNISISGISTSHGIYDNNRIGITNINNSSIKIDTTGGRAVFKSQGTLNLNGCSIDSPNCCIYVDGQSSNSSSITNIYNCIIHNNTSTLTTGYGLYVVNAQDKVKIVIKNSIFNTIGHNVYISSTTARSNIIGNTFNKGGLRINGSSSSNVTSLISEIIYMPQYANQFNIDSLV